MYDRCLQLKAYCYSHWGTLTDCCNIFQRLTQQFKDFQFQTHHRKTSARKFSAKRHQPTHWSIHSARQLGNVMVWKCFSKQFQPIWEQELHHITGYCYGWCQTGEAHGQMTVWGQLAFVETVDSPVFWSHTPGWGCSRASSCGSAAPRYGSYSAASRRGWTQAVPRSVCAFSPTFGSHSLEDLWSDLRGKAASPGKGGKPT